MARFAHGMGLRDDQARERIKRWFLSSKMTQKQFGARIGWTQPTVNSFLQGHHNTDLDTLAAMAKVFGRSLQDVVGGEEQDADELVTLLNAVDPVVRDAALVMLRGAQRQARVSGAARRSVRGPRRGEE